MSQHHLLQLSPHPVALRIIAFDKKVLCEGVNQADGLQKATNLKCMRHLDISCLCFLL